MNYRGYSILNRCGQWYAKIDYCTEYLATSKDDAKAQVDEYIERINKRANKQAA